VSTKRSKNLVNEKSVFILSVLFLLSIAGIIYYLYDYSENLVLKMAKDDASSKIDALESFRTLYSQEVVGKVKSFGMEISHEYAGKSATIPLPATFTKLLGHKMGENNDGSEAFLYSGYPFPWRAEKGGLNDSFRKNAWEYLTKYPEESYSEVIQISGRRVLRHARADLMRKACINCHNSHIQTPKNNWKVGDVRGILEVQKPIEGAIIKAGEKAQSILWMVLTIGILGSVSLLGFAMMIRSAKKSSDIANKQFKSLQELREGHIGLHKKIRGEKSPEQVAENILSHIVKYLDIDMGVIYLMSEKNGPRRIYTYNKNEEHYDTLDLTLDIREVSDVAKSKKSAHITNRSKKDDIFLNDTFITPILYADKTLGVIELSNSKAISNIQILFLEEASEGIAVTLSAAIERFRVKDLLKKSQDHATELNLQKEKLRVSNKSAQKANKVKSDFLANMSHEIRTPMNGIVGVLELLKDSKLSEEQKDLVETMETCGHGLVIVLNDILDFSKIEAGHMDFENEPFDLNKLLKSISFLYETEVKRKRISLDSELIWNGVHYFDGDELRIRQILTNLVSNAIKFTEKGTIKLSIKVERKNDSIHDVHFFVKDTGIGIPEDKLKTIFQSFSQADISTTRKYGGTGLGLSISSRLCDLMGGEMFLESTVGVGSTFSFKLPLRLSEYDKDEESSDPLRSSNWNAKKIPLSILVAEDNIINQKIIKRFMQKIGYEIDIAKDGEHAIDALENKFYDVIFMDMQMPIMGGIEATQKIINKWGDDSPTIIAMTANVMDEDRQKCFDAGMKDFLTKPVSIKSIIAALSNIEIKDKAS